MDGKIKGENLKRMGLNERWLTQELATLGYPRAEEVFLALCNKEHTLTVFPIKT